MLGIPLIKNQMNKHERGTYHNCSRHFGRGNRRFGRIVGRLRYIGRCRSGTDPSGILDVGWREKKRQKNNKSKPSLIMYYLLHWTITKPNVLTTAWKRPSNHSKREHFKQKVEFNRWKSKRTTITIDSDLLCHMRSFFFLLTKKRREGNKSRLGSLSKIKTATRIRETSRNSNKASLTIIYYSYGIISVRTGAIQLVCEIDAIVEIIASHGRFNAAGQIASELVRLATLAT